MRRPPPGLQSRGEGLTTEEEESFPMDTQNLSVPPPARSAVGGGQSHARATRRPRDHARSTAARPSGLAHENTRHTTRFTVIGNHLTQHPELSLLAIGIGCHIQSLPTGARADIKTLAARFPEGATRIAAALRELETHGYRAALANAPQRAASSHARRPATSRTRTPRRTPCRRRPTNSQPCLRPRGSAGNPAPSPPYRTRPTRPRPSSARPPTSSRPCATTTPACSSPPATRPTSPPAWPPGWSAT